MVINADKYIFNDGNMHNAGTFSWFVNGADRFKGVTLGEIPGGVYFAAHNGEMPDANEVKPKGGKYSPCPTDATAPVSVFDLHPLCNSDTELDHKKGAELWQE